MVQILHSVKKTELIIFHPKKIKLDYSVKFKLNGKRLNPFILEYLGIFLGTPDMDQASQSDKIKAGIGNQTTGVLSKLRYSTSSNMAITLYLDHIHNMTLNFWEKKVV